jgi:uncharacterized membrane protein YecN with MAPEG domain
MFRLDGEVFLLGTAIAAPVLSNGQKNWRLSSPGSSGKSRGGGRIVANGASYNGFARRCKRGTCLSDRRDPGEGRLMMQMPVTLAAAALAVIVNTWLAWRVIAARRAANVSIGDGGDEAVLRRMRAHANYAEHAPIFLILLAALEITGANRPLLLAAAAAFMLARFAHGIGMDGGSLTRFRVVGMSTSTFVTLALAGWAAVIAFGALA